MSKRYQWWGEDKGWNIRGNNNFLATHKGSKVTEFVISGQDNAYRQLFDIREKLRTESINVQHHYYAGDNIEEINSGSIKKNTPLDHKEYGIGLYSLNTEWMELYQEYTARYISLDLMP